MADYRLRFGNANTEIEMHESAISTAPGNLQIYGYFVATRSIGIETDIIWMIRIIKRIVAGGAKIRKRKNE